jgi:carboxyl-terminal processing protease
MTPPEIEGMLKEMVAPLNDDHVEIELTESYSPHLGPPEWWVAGKARDYVKLIEDKYVQLSYSSDRLIRHGSLTDDTGYILLAGMGGVLNQAQAAEIARRQFSAAITDFSEKKNLVIDLRFNRGGYDVVGLEFASFFTNEYRTAYHREVMNGGDFVPIQSVYVQPGEQFFNGEVYLLTSGATVSAAETFILAMQSVTTPIVIGEQTAGFFSDSLPRRLPNGVEFSLSHVRYYDLEGTLREGVPVIPTITYLWEALKRILIWKERSRSLGLKTDEETLRRLIEIYNVLSMLIKAQSERAGQKRESSVLIWLFTHH